MTVSHHTALPKAFSSACLWRQCAITCILCIGTSADLHVCTGCLTLLDPGNLLELFFLLEILEIFWEFAKSPGNFLAEFVCLLLLWLTILVFQNVSAQTSAFVFNCNCNC